MSDDPQLREIEHLVDYWTPMLVRMCTEAGVFDAWHDTRDPNDVAAELGLDGSVLRRVARALAANGLFESADDGTYRLTPLGARLRPGSPRSLAGLAAFRPWEIHAWAEARHSLESGASSFARHFAHDFWTHLDKNPDLGARFAAQMQRRTSTFLDLGIHAYPWPEHGVLVDLGGGNGSLLARVLELRPQLSGVLFDLPSVVAAAESQLLTSGTGERIAAVGGDLFSDRYPPGGDVYVLSSVLHDWADDRAIEILRRCSAVMSPSSRLVLFESVLSDEDGWNVGKLVDLHMLVLFGAQERTRAEWADLLARAGFALTRVVPTAGLAWLEAKPAHDRQPP